jgi:tetratricopeptide (TPR) repeat protein
MLMSQRKRNGCAIAADPKEVPLHILCDQVVGAVTSYGDLAEKIENAAYEAWSRGKVESTVNELRRVAEFFEQMENKSEENTRDLADIYFLIGQLYQYAEQYRESIEWFSKSIFVEDGNSMPYHAMAESYLKDGDVAHATKSYEQEIAIDEGNFFTYLRLVDLYNKAGKPAVAEECLKRLLTRDPENILGLHRLIRHYEKHNPSVDMTLLKKRLLGINREFNATEAIVRARYLCLEKRFTDALEFLDRWQQGNHQATVVLAARAYLFGKARRFRNRRESVKAFVNSCNGRRVIVEARLREFGEAFGESAERGIAGEVEKLMVVA